MKTILTSLLTLGIALTFSSCGNNTNQDDEDILVRDSSAYVTETPGSLQLTEAPASEEFPTAKLALKPITGTPVGTDSVQLSFNFDVSNYTLGANTADADKMGCANSAEGQHIHFILDNSPYTALYKPQHQTTVAANSEHYLLCFLSRSYHQSIKHNGAAVLLHFSVDAAGKVAMLDNPTTPMIFYSRPKGDYVGKDTGMVLLDYYLWNHQDNGENQVMAEIENLTTGMKNSITLKEWKSMLITGLGTGKAKVNLQLQTKTGENLTGPNTQASNTFTLSAAEPLPAR